MKLLFFLHPLKCFLEKTRQSLGVANLFSKNVILVIFAGSIFLATAVGYALVQQSQQLSTMQQRIERLEVRAKKTQQIRARAAEFSKKMNDAQTDFIIKALLTKKLLQKEKERLQPLRSTPILQESSSLRARCQKLERNTMLFQQKAHSEKGSMQETIYALDHPIEMEEEDVKMLLQEIEAPMASKPQAFFKTLTLERKKLSECHEVFECDFTFLQRTLKDKTT